MKSIWPWLFYIALGVAAALLLDADASIPFFIIWAVAGICMAIEADNTLMEKTKKEKRSVESPRAEATRNTPNGADQESVRAPPDWRVPIRTDRSHWNSYAINPSLTDPSRSKRSLCSSRYGFLCFSCCWALRFSSPLPPLERTRTARTPRTVRWMPGNRARFGRSRKFSRRRERSFLARW